MIIQAINQYQFNEERYKASKVKPRTDSTVAAKAAPKDTFEKTLKKADLRQELIESVRKKISLGYYSSESVMDELSTSFAKAMNS